MVAKNTVRAIRISLVIKELPFMVSYSCSSVLSKFGGKIVESARIESAVGCAWLVNATERLGMFRPKGFY
jgi:hypothetical protein